MNNIKRCVVLVFLFLYPFVSFGAVILKEDFSDSSIIKRWKAYTNDENWNNGWFGEEGMVFQKVGNFDNISGGERFLTKPGVFDLKNLRLPIEVCFDIFPYDYAGVNEVWWGLALFTDSQKPDRDEIVVAMKINDSEKKHGLNVAVGGKAWLTNDNNLSTPTMCWRWHRIKVRLEENKEKKAIDLFAKTWSEGETESSKWTVQCSLASSKFPLRGNGIAFAANALYGVQESNPRAFFDNLAVSCEGESANLFPMKSKKEGEVLREKKIRELELMYEEDRYHAFAYNFERLSHSFPELKIPPELYFSQLRALRKIREWTKARDLANMIPKKFPKTKYAEIIGGLDGRTEDQAALKFADAMKAYYNEDYAGCIPVLKEFLKEYPNNWRRLETRYYICHSFYWMRNYPELFEEVKPFHEEFGKQKDAEQIMVLEISARIHRKEQETARDLVGEFRARFPNSKRLDEIDQLDLETYFYKDNLEVTMAGWDDPDKQALIRELEGEILYFTEKWIKQDHLSWVVKNIGFLTTIYDKTNRGQESIDLIDSLLSFSETYPEARRAIYTESYGYFMKKDSYEKMEEITRGMIDWEKDPEEVNKLKKKLSLILKKQGKTEESKSILRESKNND